MIKVWWRHVPPPHGNPTETSNLGLTSRVGSSSGVPPKVVASNFDLNKTLWANHGYSLSWDDGLWVPPIPACLALSKNLLVDAGDFLVE